MPIPASSSRLLIEPSGIETFDTARRRIEAQRLLIEPSGIETKFVIHISSYSRGF